jgi:phenylacetate-CoA ligase
VLANLKAIYEKLPKENLKFLRHIPEKLLFGNSYKFCQSKISIHTQIIEQNLSDVFNYSRNNTSWGKENIPSKIYIDEVKDILSELPLVSSADLSGNLEHFASKEFLNNKSYLTTTGGTGRNPTSILLSNESFGMEWAHIHHIWSYAGYRKKTDLKLTLRGKSIKGNKLIEYNPIYNELVVDTFKVNFSNVSLLIAQLKKHPITYIHAYPSLLKEFIDYFNHFNYRPNIKGIFLGSEGASEQSKKEMSDYFNAPVIHWYGQTEKVTLAVDEEANGMYKVYTSYGLPRLVEGEIVATSFVNRALPLINYRTGDTAEIVTDETHMYLKDVKGRWGKDFVFYNKQKKIPTSSINLHSEIQSEILFYQIVQKEYGKLLIRILPKSTSKYSNENLKNILYADLESKLNNFELSICIVNESQIQRSERRKMMMLVQDIKM